MIAPLVSLVSVLLIGCGGGGSGGTGGTGGTGGNPPSTYTSLVANVPAATYTADNAAIYSQLNIVRGSANSGLLSQNTNLDAAAAHHADFLVNNSLVSNLTYLTTSFNGILGGHYESSTYDNVSLTGFIGATPAARATYAGYSGSVTEEVSFGAASGADCIASLLNSVYHLADLLSPVEQVGVAFNAGNVSGNTGGSACVIELGMPTTTLGQLAATGATAVYPANNQTGVPTTYFTAS